MSEALAERESLGAAIVDLMAAEGYERMTIEAVCARAGVEPDAFGRHFSDLEDGVLQVYRQRSDEFAERVVAASKTGGTWRDGLRAAAYVAARWVRDNPNTVRFGTSRMFAAGLMAQAARDSHLHEMVDLIDAGRQQLDDPDSVGRGLAEGTFGAIYEFLVKEVEAGRGTRSAEDFVPELMYIAVRPYLGHDVAREELSIPAPPEERTGK